VKENDEIKINSLKMKEGSSINRDVIVFAFFLFLSFVFWYFNSLGKDFEADIRYGIRYINIPADKKLNTESQDKLSLYLKGPGYAILKLKMSGRSSPFNIDISKVNYKRVPGSTNSSYFIVTSSLTKSLGFQLRSECEIMSIKPDTLFFTFERVSLNSALSDSEVKSLTKNRK
jgi:hypothetical protein